MKKIIALLLAITIMCFSFVACDSNKTPDESENTSANEQDAKDSIELTLENFDTYFEFVDDPIFTKNSSGEIDALRFRHYYKLKEEFKIDTEKSTIELTYKHSASTRDITVDFKNEKYTIGSVEKDKKMIENRVVNKISNITYKDVAILLLQPDAVKSESALFTYYNEFELTSVKGTLYFINE